MFAIITPHYCHGDTMTTEVGCVVHILYYFKAAIHHYCQSFIKVNHLWCSSYCVLFSDDGMFQQHSTDGAVLYSAHFNRCLNTLSWAYGMLLLHLSA